MMRKNLYQSIRRSIGRYIAIAVIIALGAGMFTGLRATRMDMVATGQVYTDAQNMFDLRLISGYGWSEEQVAQVQQLPGVVDAEGQIYRDLIASMEGSDSNAVYRFHAIPERINKVVLRAGRMPERADECLADGFHNSEKLIGTVLHVSPDNDADALENLTCQSFTVVGLVSSPLYMDMNRGSTSVGNGSISNYFYIPAEAFQVDYLSEIHVTIPGAYAIYTDAYNDAMKDAADALEPLLAPLAQQRLALVRRDAEDAYSDGYREYQDGLQEYQDGEAEAMEKLADAFRELLDGEDTLRKTERQLLDGEQMIADAKVSIQDGRKSLNDARKTLADSRVTAYEQLTKASNDLLQNFQTVSANLRTVESALLKVQSGLLQLDSGITQLENGISQIDIALEAAKVLLDVGNIALDTAQTALDTAKEAGVDAETIAQLQKGLDNAVAMKEKYAAQVEDLSAQRGELAAQLQELQTQRTAVVAQQTQLEVSQTQLNNAMDQINTGFLQLQSQQTLLQQQLAAAEVKINVGAQNLDIYEEQLAQQEQEVADGWIQLAQGKQDWKTGYQEYIDGRLKAKKELDEAKAELADAEAELLDARKTIDSMTENDVLVLDRNSNIGYSSLDSSSNIVAGVSRVFPVFFLLVAALVCITTMTRMVDEERTQIGVLKALGYGNGAIIGKYLLYAGSSAVFGCTLGVILGSIAFPVILWEAYKIMIYITPTIELRFDWVLCAVVIAVYTGAMLLVTWNCCRMELREVPAELIRPKAPTVGKTLFLENTRLWSKIRFLDKVAIRNIFRYRQRLAMMLLGIGGCAALLLTGFGFRDSIMNIVDIQFREVTVYDMQVYFRGATTEESRQAFEADMAPFAQEIQFFSQSNAQMDNNGRTRDVTMLAGTERLTDFIDFHSGSKGLSFPGVNEVLISSGMRDLLNLELGDTVKLRNPDMEEMELTISGIFDNHVYNYAVICPETMQVQWGRMPEEQMAFVQAAQGVDVYAAAAEAIGLDDVMNVMVSQETANMVRGMMEALDLVVLVIVFCAALLAAIVLYNLTNININERIREIATIKVLGFRAGETAMYVFKENLVLSVAGCAFGMPLGRLLLRFVLSQIKIDLIWIEPRLSAAGYLWSVVLTLLTAVIVDIVFYFRLDKINMAEALKSVE